MSQARILIASLERLGWQKTGRIFAHGRIEMEYPAIPGHNKAYIGVSGAFRIGRNHTESKNAPRHKALLLRMDK